jgi:hypothetical protein
VDVKNDPPSGEDKNKGNMVGFGLPPVPDICGFACIINIIYY